MDLVQSPSREPTWSMVRIVATVALLVGIVVWPALPTAPPSQSTFVSTPPLAPAISFSTGGRTVCGTARPCEKAAQAASSKTRRSRPRAGNGAPPGQLHRALAADGWELAQSDSAACLPLDRAAGQALLFEHSIE